MKDHHEYKTQSTNHGDKKIVELTSQMELSDQHDGDIIDLTNSIESPDTPSNETIPAASPSMKTEVPAKEPGQVSAQKEPPPGSIEDEAEATFETAQTVPAQEMEKDLPDDQLFDRLSEIPEMVDRAVRENEEPRAIKTEETETGAAAADIPDEDSLAADAAVVAAAMEPESTADEIDIIDPAGAAATTEPLDDDEIIKLTEIVDPTESASVPVAGSGDEEIVELTDIVDPAQIAAENDDQEEILKLTDIVAQNISAPDETTALQETERQETAQTADLFVKAMVPDSPRAAENHRPTQEEQTAGPPLSQQGDASEEQVIQLSDVLGQTDRQERPPIEKVKMSAEEDLEIKLNQQAPEKKISLTDKKIQTAVEHILQTKFAGTIERLAADAVEKAVKQQMEALKRTQGDNDAKT